MKKFTSILKLILLLQMVFNYSFAQVCNLQYDQLPPCLDTSADHSYAGQYHQNYGGIVDLSDAIHYGFTNCFPPPVNIGDTTLHSFGSMAMGTINVTGGGTFTMNSPAQVTVQVIYLSQNGNTRTFANEMTQLDISGGTLPPMALIRESPTHATTGMTTIEDMGGTFCITSYFDVWTDLSLDSGATWIPCDTSGRMTLVDYPLNITLTSFDDFTVTVSPNPVDALCNFSFTGINSSKTLLQIFDFTGKLISTVFNQSTEKGKKYSIQFDRRNLPDGLYFYKYSSSEKTANGKLVFMK